MSAEEIHAVLPSLLVSEIPRALFHLSKKGLQAGNPPASTFARVQPLIVEAKPRAIFDLFCACKQFHVTDSFWKALCVRGQTCSFDAIAIAGVLHVVAHKTDQRTLQPFETKLVKHLVDLAQAKSSEFDGWGLVNLLQSIAKLQPQDKAGVTKLFAELKRVKSFNAQEIVTILNVCSKLQMFDKELMERILREAKPLASEFIPQGIAIVLHALAKFDLTDEEFANRMMESAVSKINEFNAQDIVSMMNSLANPKWSDNNIRTELVAALVQAAKGQVASLRGHQVASMLYSLSKLEVERDAELVEQLVQAARSKLKEFMPLHVSNTLIALTNLECYDEKLVHELVEIANDKVYGFNPQDVSNTLNALATLFAQTDEKTDDQKDLLRRLLDRAKLKSEQFSAPNISNTLSALVRLDLYDEELVKLLVEQVNLRAEYFPSREAALVLEALAKFKLFDHQSLVTRLTQVITTTEADAQTISIAMYALAKLGVADEELMMKVGKIDLAFLSTPSTQTRN